ncbi:hypothetical protein BS17DRAFT_780673, partial [Gyrodon lividus]
TVLDIKANLSLEILGGLVEVRGSASYLNDTKSNTHERAWAMALKMQLHERRILFAEDDLGRNVLEVAIEDYISPNLATHFVSSIVYGGNLIVNLVARSSKLSRDERIEGNLEAELNSLKGMVDLNGRVGMEVKDKFTGMNDKFDVVMHGDVALGKVPINPLDVLDTFPDAAKLIAAGRGVPISVVLQPIPTKLRERAVLVYHIERHLMNDILDVFAKLDDLRSRFAVLVDATKTYQDFIPELARMARVIAARYAEDHGKLLDELGQFISDFQHGREQKPNSAFATAMTTEDTLDSSTTKVLVDARKLYDTHTDATYRDNLDGRSAPYRSSLASLEMEFSKFQYFVADIQGATKDQQGSSGSGADSSCHLSSLEDVCRAPRLQTTIPLFVMTPLTRDNPDLAVVRFLSILRTRATYLDTPSVPAYILYAESLEHLEHRLPNETKFAALTRPALYVGRVNDDGDLSWTIPDADLSPVPQHDWKFIYRTSNNAIELLCGVDKPIDGTKSFSILVKARLAPGNSPGSFLVLLDRRDRCAIVFEVPVRVEIWKSGIWERDVISDGRTQLEANKPFTATFVQDAMGGKRYLYIDDKKVGETSFDVTSINPAFAQLRLCCSNNRLWWNGEVNRVKAFASALTAEQITVQAFSKDEEQLPVTELGYNNYPRRMNWSEIAIAASRQFAV